MTAESVTTDWPSIVSPSYFPEPPPRPPRPSQHADEVHAAGLRGLLPCTRVDPELFFPEHGPRSKDIAEAAAWVCRSCVVRTACAEWALSEPRFEGVWGGLSAKQRERIRGMRKRAAEKLGRAS